jgi:hypothetical protein
VVAEENEREKGSGGRALYIPPAPLIKIEMDCQEEMLFVGMSRYPHAVGPRAWCMAVQALTTTRSIAENYLLYGIDYSLDLFELSSNVLTRCTFRND